MNQAPFFYFYTIKSSVFPIMKRYSILFYFFFLFGSTHSYSQVAVFTENCEQAYYHILSLQFQEAEHLLDKEEQQHEDNVYVPYLRNYIDFISLFVSQDKVLYEKLDANKSDKFYFISQLSDTCRFKKLMLGNMHLQWSLTKITFGDFFSAAIEFNNAYKLIKDNTNEFPDFKLNLLSQGILDIIVGLVPDKYGWIMRLFSMEGEIKQGKKELSEFLTITKEETQYSHLYYETLFYSGFIEMNINPDKHKINYLLNESSLIDDSVLLVTFLKINLLMRSGDNDKALKIFEDIDLADSKTYPFYYLEYLFGECLLRAQKWSSSIEKYDLFTQNFKGENYIKDAWRKKAWATFLQNDTSVFLDYMEDVIQYGATNIGIDKEALQESKNRHFPNKDLLMARILFDGGYYADALSLLNNTDTADYSQEERVDYVYRKARIYDCMEDYLEAKEFYAETIIKGKTLESYYAANAALKLGAIYEMEGNIPLAKKNYSVCLELNFEQYKNSIKRRAQEGLKRVSD